MVNRSHIFNSSNYSLSSLFSVSSVSGSIASGTTSRAGSTRSRRFQWQGPAPLHTLYNLLIDPIENYLPTDPMTSELLLILDGDLYLVPFAMLKGEGSSEYLCERFSISAISSLSALRASQRSRAVHRQANKDYVSALVVGNPKLTTTITEQWGLGDIPQAEQEATLVGEMLGTKAVVGAEATKEALLNQLAQAECIHLATHISWKLSAIVLSPGDFVEASSPKCPQQESLECCEDASLSSSTHIPPLSDFLLTAADILNLQLTARLVVVSSCNTRNHHGRSNSDGVVGLTRALLAAGAQCVLVSLWPVPDTAVKILMRTFYSSLLQGSCVSIALAEAMRTIQTTKHFAHPANWASFLLVGSDVKLSSQVALLGQALADVIKTPEKCRDALRVVLHLVEKSLQRIHRGHKNAMYTTQKSIENKVGSVIGWKELLISVGFRFEPASNGLPASVFFPQSDPGERLTQCSASLQALLGLSSVSLSAISKLLPSPDSAENISQLLRNMLSELDQKQPEVEGIECKVSVKLWSIPGCHELLASLGFDLMEVGRDEVTLRMGKQANRRTVQFAQQALLAIFDTQEAPKSLSYDNSSSLESLSSVPSESRATPPPFVQPAVPFSSPHPNIGNLMLGKNTSAFTSYVRTRGEPDGHTSTSAGDQKGRDSDTFTPSPVETLAKAYATHQGSRAPVQVGSHLALALAHQRKIRTMYGNESPPNDKRPDSSSSASSVNDWDSGQTTVRRQPREYEMSKYSQVVQRKKENGNSYRVVQAEDPHRGQLTTCFNGNGEEFSTQESNYDYNASFTVGKKPMDFTNRRAATLAPRSKNISMFLDALPHYEDIRDFTSRPDKHQNKTMGPSNPGQHSTSPIKASRNKLLLNGDQKHRSSSADVLAVCIPSDDIQSIRTIPNYTLARTGSLSDQELDRCALNPQIHHFGREPPITEVYHDRTMGLGLAPSLSKILISDKSQNFHDISDIDASLSNGDARVIKATNGLCSPPERLPNVKPPIPPKHSVRIPPKLPHKKSVDAKVSTMDASNSVPNFLKCSVRDEGDGGSLTETSFHRTNYAKHLPRDYLGNVNASNNNCSATKDGGRPESSNSWHSTFLFPSQKTTTFSEMEKLSVSGGSESECSDLDSNSSQKVISTVRRNPRHVQNTLALEKDNAKE